MVELCYFKMRNAFSVRLFRFGNRNQRRPDYAIMQLVAFLQYGHNRIAFGIALYHADGLMFMRVEFLTGRVDFINAGFFEGAG